jgi:hypothetical protein
LFFKRVAAMPEGLAFEECHGYEWPSIVLIDIEDMQIFE